jgi:hypothetical protein
MQFHNKDAVVPFHSKDLCIVKMCCDSLHKIYKFKRVFVIGSLDPKIENTLFINEHDIKNIVSLDEIRARWFREFPPLWQRSGWIYQQFIKLGASQIIPDISEDFLISDSDIIFLRNLYSEIEEEEAIFPYAPAFTGEYHAPYRASYFRLLKENPESGFSFINHHMWFNKQQIKNLKSFIEEKNSDRWDNAILNSIDYSQPSNFSEYDLYGNWIFKYNKEKMRKIENIKVTDVYRGPTEEDAIAAKEAGFDILGSPAFMRGGSPLGDR